MKLSDLPKEQREKLIGDVFCIQCQQSFRLENYTEREFRGILMIEGKCPRCGSTLAKPVSTRS